MLSHELDVVRRQEGQDWDFYPFRALVSLLQSFSLINRDEDDLFYIHRLVHIWLRDRLKFSDEDTVWKPTISTVAPRKELAEILFVDVCLGNRTDRFFDVQILGVDCQTMAGGFVPVHGEAGPQPDVLQNMARATQLNTRKFSKSHKTLVNTYSEMGRRREGADPSKICDGSKKEIPGDHKVETLNALHCLTLEPF